MIMNSDENPQMHRSISMPVKPRHLEVKTLIRSDEKETIYKDDYYPESPDLEQRKKSSFNENKSLRLRTRSDNNFPYTNDWAGSTIELDADIRSNDLDIMQKQKRLYRVVEKNGKENVSFRRIPQKSWRYFRDFVTTLVRPLLKFLPQKHLTIKKDTILINNNINDETETINQSNIIKKIQNEAEDEELEVDWHNQTNKQDQRVKFSLY